MNMKNNFCFGSADILLPREISDKAFAARYAVIACDQFTSEPEYWEKVEKIVRGAPSTLRLILPEAYLGASDEGRLPQIAEKMREYEKNLFDCYPDALIYVRRTVTGGRIRRGIVGKIDLTAYDYAVGSASPVRATEGTVLSRIPPRVAVRRAATLEAPHIMLLMDDKEKRVIESLDDKIADLPKLYDFDLMQNGGHIEGYLVRGKQKDDLLAEMTEVCENSGSTIQFAVGDGNHSLASAKARFEEIRCELGDAAAMEHPLRYALCEVVNLHEDALVFEPIYRIATVNAPQDFLKELAVYGASCGAGTQSVHWVYGGEEGDVSLGGGTHALTVGTLQNFLDKYKEAHPETEIDYIHGENSLRKLSKRENTVGFLFEGMRKEELFSAVEQDGALPRKTFSMGEATDKRYYIECRKIEK